MGWWGHLGAPKQRGIVTYTLSPYEQRAFAGALHQAIFNTFRRVTGQAFYIAVPLGAAYGIYTWGKENHRTSLHCCDVYYFSFYVFSELYPTELLKSSAREDTDQDLDIIPSTTTAFISD